MLSVLGVRGSEDEDKVQLGASNAARALLAALELERGEDAAGGADRDELIEEKAAGARLSVERDPAGQRGARRAGRMQMKREPRGWRDASKAFLSLHRVTRKLPQLCKRPAGSESEPRRGLTCIRRGAYGAVGFSGVKDARKSVLFADALASAVFSGAFPGGLQKDTRSTASGLQTDSAASARKPSQPCSTSAAPATCTAKAVSSYSSTRRRGRALRKPTPAPRATRAGSGAPTRSWGSDGTVITVGHRPRRVTRG